MSAGSSYTPIRPYCHGDAYISVDVPRPWNVQIVAGTPQLTVAAWRTEVVDEVTVPVEGTFRVLAYGANWYFNYLLEFYRLTIISPWGDGMDWACVIMRATPVEQLYDLTEQANLNPESLQLTLDRLAQQGQDGTPYLDGEAVTVLAHDESDTNNKLSRRPVVLATKDYTDQSDTETLAAAALAAAVIADAKVAAHNISPAAHADIRSEIDSDIAAHNVAEAAHADIRAAIPAAVAVETLARQEADEAHAASGTAHADIRATVTAEAVARAAADSAHNADETAHGGIIAKVAVLEAYNPVEHLARVTVENATNDALSAHVNNHAIHLTPGGGIPEGTAPPLITFALPTDADGDTLWPEVTLSDNAAFTGGVTVVYDGRPVANGGGGYTANMQLFDGTAWVVYPATGAGLGYHGKRVAFAAPGLAPVAGQVYYGRVRVWDGIAWSDYAGFSDIFAYGLPTGGGDVTLAQMNAAIDLAKSEAVAAAQVAADAIDDKADAAVLAANAAAADAAEALAAVGGGIGDAVTAHNASGTAHADIRNTAIALAATVSGHAAAANPHPVYRLAATATVASVNGASGAVVLTPAGLSAEPALGNATAGQVLLSGGAAVRAWGSIPVMVGAGAGAASTVGAVPEAAAGMQNAVLTGAATWVKRRHYFVHRLLGIKEVVTLDEKASFRIPLSGRIVKIGMGIDRVGSSTTWFFYSQLTKNGENQLTNSAAGLMKLGEAAGEWSEKDVSIAVAGPIDLWKVVTVVRPTEINLNPTTGWHRGEGGSGGAYGLSVWFIVEEA